MLYVRFTVICNSDGHNGLKMNIKLLLIKLAHMSSVRVFSCTVTVVR